MKKIILILFALTLLNLSISSVLAQANCQNPGTNGFCGQLIITEAGTLTFIDIPDSFTFSSGTNVSASNQARFNNDINPPDSEDLLVVEDTRSIGGFEVTLNASSAFTNGTNEIPLNNLYVVTTPPDPSSGIIPTTTTIKDGITYDNVITTNLQTINASVAAFPLNPGDPQSNLGNSVTFTTNGSSFHDGTNHISISLMDGPLSSISGRNGRMYQFLNYYLNIPAFQQAGTYQINLLFSLSDSTN